MPWEEEDDAPVGGGGVEEAHGARGVVVGEGDVDAGGWLDDMLLVGVVELQEGISEGAGCVDYTLGNASESKDFRELRKGILWL